MSEGRGGILGHRRGFLLMLKKGNKVTATKCGYTGLARVLYSGGGGGGTEVMGGHNIGEGAIKVDHAPAAFFSNLSKRKRDRFKKKMEKPGGLGEKGTCY